MKFIKKFINKFDNKYFFCLCLFIIITEFVLIIFSIQNYPGSKLIYLFFSFLILIYVTFSFFKSDSFFHIFLSILVFLGFFWKLSLNLIYNIDNGVFKNFSRNILNSTNCLNNKCNNIYELLYNPFLYDKTLIVSIIGISGFLCSSLFYRIIKNKINVSKNLIPNFIFEKYIHIFIFFSLIIIILISYINYEYLFFSKGIASKSNIPFLNNFFGWVLLYGIPTLLTFYLNFEHKTKRNNFFLALNLSHVVHFIVNISLLSRGMIFSTFSNILGYIKSNKNPEFIKFFISCIFLLILFISSIHFVSVKRAIFYSNKKDNSNLITYENLSRSNKNIFNLLRNRWVGIEEVMLVENYKNKNFNFFVRSLYERQSDQKIPLFDLEIYKDYHNIDRTKFNFVSIPGLIAFVYFSNSYLLIFFVCFFLSMFFSIIEILALKISINNLFFTSLIGQLLAYRIMHFGVYPIETYKFLISILFCIIMHYVINKIFLK